MKLQFVVSAHKIIGMVATIFIVILSITGILLMHTDDLALDDTYTDNKTLMALYDIAPEDQPVSFMANNDYISQIDDHIYLNEVGLGTNADRLIGALYLDGIFVLGFESSLMLVTPQGEVIEVLSQAHGIPQGISSIGKTNDRIILNVSGTLKSSDLDMVEWKDYVQGNVNWSMQIEAPNLMMDNILKLYLGDGLPVERVILDIHSGRILGTAGVIIVDLAVILFLILSISGWLAWYKKRELQKLIDAEDEHY